MEFTTTRVEDYQPVTNKPGHLRLVSENYYIRLAEQGEAVFIQNGKVWYEGGQECKQLPTWFHAAVKQCTPAALAAAKYKVKDNGAL